MANREDIRHTLDHESTTSKPDVKLGTLKPDTRLTSLHSEVPSRPTPYDVNAVDKDGRVALTRHVNKMEALTERSDKLGRTHPHLAAENDSKTAAKTLTQHDINTNVTGLHGRTRLHIAAQYNSILTIKILLENGADVNATDETGQTPLHVAVHHARSYSIIRLLLENGADVNATDETGQTPIHVAVINNHSNSIKHFII